MITTIAMLATIGLFKIPNISNLFSLTKQKL